MQLARGSWVVIGLVGGAIVLGLIALMVRPPLRPPIEPATTQAEP